MTSNLGSDLIQEFKGEDYDKMKQAVMEVVGAHFRPEFINRIDETVVFHPLERDQIENIAKIQLANIERRLNAKDYKLEFMSGALEFLANAGYDPVYGARPLKRAIQHYLENPLAEDLLKGRFVPGDTIKVKKGEQRLEFES